MFSFPFVAEYDYTDDVLVCVLILLLATSSVHYNCTHKTLVLDKLYTHCL